MTSSVKSVRTSAGRHQGRQEPKTLVPQANAEPWTALQIPSAPLVRLERETLQSKILAQLEERLITGVFRPGEKLTLRTLAAQLGTSLMPVRDAIQHLQSIGALQSNANRTTTVPVVTPSERQGLSEVRFVLETLAAERATHLGDRAGFARLQERWEALRCSREEYSGAGYLQAHWAFHRELALLGGIPALVDLLTSLWLRIGPTVEMNGQMRDGKLEALTIHRAIVDAVVARDPAAARRALEVDIFYGTSRQDLTQSHIPAPSKRKKPARA